MDKRNLKELNPEKGQLVLLINNDIHPGVDDDTFATGLLAYFEGFRGYSQEEAPKEFTAYDAIVLGCTRRFGHKGTALVPNVTDLGGSPTTRLETEADKIFVGKEQITDYIKNSELRHYLPMIEGADPSFIPCIRERGIIIFPRYNKA